MCKSKKFLQIYGRDFVGKTVYLVFFFVKQPTDACFLHRHAYGFFYKKATTSFKLAVVVVTLQCLKGRRGNAGIFRIQNMKKQIKDYIVRSNERLSDSYSLLKLQPADGSAIIDTCAGQFVEVEVPDSKSTFLRRPISINFVDRDRNELWLLVRVAGEGTRHLVALAEGRVLSLVLPLGKGFSIPADTVSKVLLAGGGVGVAPMLYLGSELKKRGFEVAFLLGARSKGDLLELEEFEKIGGVYVSTDDGSMGEHGLITKNSALQKSWQMLYCCGPMPMMKAMAAYAMRNNIECEVSLENRMACGVGACLCCVEDTVEGNLCVCKEGPVFNIKRLEWQI